MANGLFASYRTVVLSAPPNLSSANIRAGFIDHADDTPVIATDDFINDILAAARVPATFTSWPLLGTKTLGTLAAGVFDAADTLFTALTGDQSESLIIARDTGTESSSDLIAFWDTATGLPLTPNGGDVTVVWNGSGIFTF